MLHQLTEAFHRAKEIDLSATLTTASTYLSGLLPPASPPPLRAIPSAPTQALAPVVKAIDPLDKYSAFFIEIDDKINASYSSFAELSRGQRWDALESVEILMSIIALLNALHVRVTVMLQQQALVNRNESGHQEIIDQLMRKQQSLENGIKEYNASLLERKLFKNMVQEKAAILREVEASPEENVRLSFGHAYLTFLSPELRSRISLQTILLFILPAYGQEGAFHSAGKELCKHICFELFRRIEAESLSDRNEDFIQINARLQALAVDIHKMLNQQIQINLQQKADAFRRIYRAMHAAQTGFFKSDFMRDKANLSDNDLIHQVREHTASHPICRTARTWRLTQLHYRNVNDENLPLFKEVYKDGIKHSFFMQSKVSGETYIRKASCEDRVETLTLEQVASGKTKLDSRTQKICFALGRKRA